MLSSWPSSTSSAANGGGLSLAWWTWASKMNQPEPRISLASMMPLDSSSSVRNFDPSG